MSPVVKQSLHWIGSAIAFVGIVFVAIRLNSYSSQLNISQFDGYTWTIVSGFALVYALANTLLAFAWWNLLRYFGATTSRFWAVRIYGLTQLAKYVPGNIMHLASRQAMGLASGVRGWPLAKASVWELGLISIVGAFFSILLMPEFIPYVNVLIATLCFGVVLLIMVIVLNQYVGLPIARAFGWYVLFLIISGMVFVGLLTLLVGDNHIAPIQALTFCGAFIIAWLVGLVTPGAPAGVGVRELVLMVLLKGQVPDADLLLAVLLSRVVTVAGDVLFFLLAILVARRGVNSKMNHTKE